MGMALDLVNLRKDPGVITQVQQPVQQKIAYADGTDLSFLIQLFQCALGTVIISEGHMDQIQVQIGKSQVV